MLLCRTRARHRLLYMRMSAVSYCASTSEPNKYMYTCFRSPLVVLGAHVEPTPGEASGPDRQAWRPGRLHAAVHALPATLARATHVREHRHRRRRCGRLWFHLDFFVAHRARAAARAARTQHCAAPRRVLLSAALPLRVRRRRRPLRP